MRNLATEKIPQPRELVICVVKRIFPYGAICVLPEYDNLEAFLHVSEIAPRWIKNIHEFISEGRQYVARVHRIDTKKAQIDISLKRVTEEEKRRKIESVRQEKRFRRMLEFAIKSSKSKLKYDKVEKELLKVYEDIPSCFEYVFEEGADALKDVKLPKKIKEKIVEMAKTNIKKTFVEVHRDLNLVCYGENGLDHIKEILSIPNKDKQLKEKTTTIYLGAPRYRITLKSDNYKQAEKELNKIIVEMSEKAKKLSCNLDIHEANA